jgi:alginate O-acetyltransferase complex protein AlgI
MLFNSFGFIFGLLPVALAAFWLLIRIKARWSTLWLCAVSYAFYCFSETVYPWLIIASMAFNYAVGLKLHGATKPNRRALLIVGLVGNLSTLIFFKYFNFVAGQLGALNAAWSIILPIGISFYTFTQIAYLVDIYQGKSFELDPVRYFLFVTFFPHLIAGPILHHREMMPQFIRAPNAREPNEGVTLFLFSGLAMFSIGLFKKVLIADGNGQIATDIFAASIHSPPDLIKAWIGVLAYTAQIYFDFSAYSDMAIGISQMFGIKMPINFNSPYKAVSIIDFWKRWHITLSRFLRDYLYIPLGGSRRGPARRYLNLMLTMCLGGLWHGAGWTFLVWGTLHGVALAVAHLWADISRKYRSLQLPTALTSPLTFAFVAVAWVPFRSIDLSTTFTMWRGMFGLNGLVAPQLGWLGELAARSGLRTAQIGIARSDILLIVVSLLIAWFAPNSQQITARFNLGLDSPSYDAKGKSTRLKLGPNFLSACAIGITLAIAVRTIGGYSEFIYFQF